MQMLIKEFRGKSVSDNKWVFGQLFISKEKTYIVEGNNYDLNSIKFVRVFSGTVGESTNFYIGKNKGLLLYEGDVVEHNRTLFQVLFFEDIYAFCLINKRHKTRGGHPNWRDFKWLSRVSKHIKFRGNIYDNPELLKEVG